jgi:hypothetical protein
MREVRFPNRLPFWEVGADGYQEFRAAILVKRAVPIVGPDPLLLIEHQRAFQVAFDRHLDRLRRDEVPVAADYLATWLGMTCGPAGPPLVRLDLAVEGLRSHVRLLFRQRTLPALWLLVDGALLGLLARPVSSAAQVALTPAWVLGPTPTRRDLKRILRRVGAPTPPWLELSRRARRRTLGRHPALAAAGGAQ